MPEIIPGELILLAVDGDAAVLDAIGVTPDGCTEIGLVILGIVVFQVVETQHDITQFTVSVRHQQRNDAPTVVGDAHFHPGSVPDGVELRRLFAARSHHENHGSEKDFLHNYLTLNFLPIFNGVDALMPLSLHIAPTVV